MMIAYRSLNLWLLGVLALSATRNVLADSQRCPTALPDTTAMEVYHDKCYQFVSEERYWTSARDYCIRYGGRLVKIDDPDTNSFIVNKLNSLWWRNSGVWIGLHDRNRERNWQWIGQSRYFSESVHWTNWGRGHPGAFLHSLRDCVRMVRSGGRWLWHETPCAALNWQYRYICEYGVLAPPETPTPLRNPSTTTTVEPSTTGKRTTMWEFVPVAGHHRHHHRELTTAEPSSETSSGDENKSFRWAFMSSKEKSNNNSRSVSSVVTVIAICILTFFLILVGFLLWRRRQYRKLDIIVVDEDSVKSSKTCLSESSETVEDNPRGTMPRAVPNAYEDVNVASLKKNPAVAPRSWPVAEKKETTVYCPMDGRNAKVVAVNCRPRLDSPVGYQVMGEQVDYGNCSSADAPASQDLADWDSAVTEDSSCGALKADLGYDSPRPSNIYSEIPDDDYNEEDHIYEPLDKVKV